MVSKPSGPKLLIVHIAKQWNMQKLPRDLAKQISDAVPGHHAARCTKGHRIMECGQGATLMPVCYSGSPSV